MIPKSRGENAVPMRFPARKCDQFKPVRYIASTSTLPCMLKEDLIIEQITTGADGRRAVGCMKPRVVRIFISLNSLSVRSRLSSNA